MKEFLDDFGNMATIKMGYGFPYKGATQKVEEFTLSLFALYDDCKLYFLSIYETEEDAIEKLNSLSCGTFKKADKNRIS